MENSTQNEAGKLVCENCKYYLQHYILNNGKLDWVFCGHCTLSRPRIKKPDAPACGDFILGQPQTSRCVTKQYLTKELLQYFLQMELLPEIEKNPGL